MHGVHPLQDYMEIADMLLAAALENKNLKLEDRSHPTKISITLQQQSLQTFIILKIPISFLPKILSKPVAASVSSRKRLLCISTDSSILSVLFLYWATFSIIGLKPCLKTHFATVSAIPPRMKKRKV